MLWDEEINVSQDEMHAGAHELDLYYFHHGLEIDRIINTHEIYTYLEDVTCPVCYMVVVSPVMCKTCEQTFCQGCAISWLEKASSPRDCPCCRGYGVSALFGDSHHGQHAARKFYTSRCPKLLQNLLSKISVSCVYAPRGCDEAVGYDFLSKHEYECGYQRVVCTNRGCNRQFLKKDLDAHRRECAYELIACPHCTRSVMRADIDTHMRLCEYRLVECCHCSQSYYAFEIYQHEKELCLMRPVNCKICNNTFTSLQMQTHTPAACYKQLYDAQCVTVRRMEERQGKLERENKELKKNCQYLSKELLRYKQNHFEANEDQFRFREDDLYDYPEDFESADEEDHRATKNGADGNEKRKMRAAAAAAVTANSHIFGRETEDTSSFDEFFKPVRYARNAYSNSHTSGACSTAHTRKNFAPFETSAKKGLPESYAVSKFDDYDDNNNESSEGGSGDDDDYNNNGDAHSAAERKANGESDNEREQEDCREGDERPAREEHTKRRHTDKVASPAEEAAAKSIWEELAEIMCVTSTDAKQQCHGDGREKPPLVDNFFQDVHEKGLHHVPVPDEDASRLLETRPSTGAIDDRRRADGQRLVCDAHSHCVGGDMFDASGVFTTARTNVGVVEH